MQIINLVRKNLVKLIPYQSARKIGGQGDIFVNANESPYLTKYFLKENVFNRYPEPQPQNLISAYANYVLTPAQNILVSRGSDEAIDLLIKSFCEPLTDSILYCTPTYGMYKIIAQTYMVNFKEIPLDNNFEINVSEIEKNLSQVKIVFICSPNNPTGNLIKYNNIKQLLKITKDKCLVVIDEAYIEFAQKEVFTKEIFNFDNLVILRTLSKAFGLAGLRCGFTIANSQIIDTLLKVIAPYPIPLPVIDIASQALTKENIQLMQEQVSNINNAKKILINNLKRLKIVEHIYNSDTNFILVKFIKFQEIFDYLWHKGIILRNQDTNIEGCLRITIGTNEENKIIVEKLQEYEINYFKGID